MIHQKNNYDVHLKIFFEILKFQNLILEFSIQEFEIFIL
jgi:hypothetical protein